MKNYWYNLVHEETWHSLNYDEFEAEDIDAAKTEAMERVRKYVDVAFPESDHGLYEFLEWERQVTSWLRYVKNEDGEICWRFRLWEEGE